jgi:hypothetical protein
MLEGFTTGCRGQLPIGAMIRRARHTRDGAAHERAIADFEAWIQEDIPSVNWSLGCLPPLTLALWWHCAENATLRHPLQGSPNFCPLPQHLHGHHRVGFDQAFVVDDSVCSGLRPDPTPQQF